MTLESRVSNCEAKLINRSLIFSKKYFWLSEGAVEHDRLATYLSNEKTKDIAHDNAAHASQTGKGLLFFAKRAEDKGHPQGILNLADMTDMAKGNFNDFTVSIKGNKHTFQAQTKGERDGWLVALESKITDAKSARSNIVGSTGYKSQHEKFNSSTMAAVGGSSRSLSRHKKTSKSHERAPTSGVETTDSTVTSGAGLDAAAVPADEKRHHHTEKSRSQSRGKRSSIFGGLLGKKEEDRAIKREEKEIRKEERAADASTVPAATSSTTAPTLDSGVTHGPAGSTTAHETTGTPSTAHGASTTAPSTTHGTTGTAVDQHAPHGAAALGSGAGGLDAAAIAARVMDEPVVSGHSGTSVPNTGHLTGTSTTGPNTGLSGTTGTSSTADTSAVPSGTGIAGAPATGTAPATETGMTGTASETTATGPSTTGTTTAGTGPDNSGTTTTGTGPSTTNTGISTSSATPKTSKRSSVFGNMFAKKDGSPATSPAVPPKDSSVLPKPTSTAVPSEAAPAEGTSASNAATASPSTERRRTSFFGGLSNRKRNGVNSGDELTDNDTRKSSSNSSGGLGGLLRKASRAQHGSGKGVVTPASDPAPAVPGSTAATAQHPASSADPKDSVTAEGAAVKETTDSGHVNKEGEKLSERADGEVGSNAIAKSENHTPLDAAAAVKST